MFLVDIKTLEFGGLPLSLTVSAPLDRHKVYDDGGSRGRKRGVIPGDGSEGPTGKEKVSRSLIEEG